MKNNGAPPVWVMVKEAMKALRGNASRSDIQRWVRRKYPNAKPITIACQTTICTVNNPVRVQFAQNAKPRTTRNQYDFVFQQADGRLVTYVPRKHGFWEIFSGRDGKLVIRRLRVRTTAAPRRPQLHVFFCGAPSENEDYAILSNLAETGGRTSWSGASCARAGDRVLFYTVAERHAFMASGWVQRDAEPTNDKSDYPYRTIVGGIRLLRSPVPISLTRRVFPKWGWARYTRNYTTVPAGIAQRLWSVIHKAGESEPAPEPQQTVEYKTKKRAGGGFGNSEQNKLVEQAAIKFVTEYLTRKKYGVKSREAEKIGYDLDAQRGKEILHAEVKGVSGDALNFIITQSEVATARIDPFFRLFVVNRPLAKKPGFTEFSGSELDRLFSLTPISYTASKK
ncbi:MAG TPA: DUF3883 domain-containing protein [Lacunisphaera sp.]|jgi:hypothetical protein